MLALFLKCKSRCTMTQSKIPKLSPKMKNIIGYLREGGVIKRKVGTNQYHIPGGWIVPKMTFEGLKNRKLIEFYEKTPNYDHYTLTDIGREIEL